MREVSNNKDYLDQYDAKRDENEKALYEAYQKVGSILTEVISKNRNYGSLFDALDLLYVQVSRVTLTPQQENELQAAFKTIFDQSKEKSWEKLKERINKMSLNKAVKMKMQRTAKSYWQKWNFEL